MMIVSMIPAWAVLLVAWTACLKHTASIRDSCICRAVLFMHAAPEICCQVRLPVTVAQLLNTGIAAAALRPTTTI